jgi:hypothetical protein
VAWWAENAVVKTLCILGVGKLQDGSLCTGSPCRLSTLLAHNGWVALAELGAISFGGRQLAKNKKKNSKENKCFGHGDDTYLVEVRHHTNVIDRGVVAP